MPKKVWTDEKLTKYKALRDAGLSLLQIEDLMGITDRQARAAGEIIRKRQREAGLLDPNAVSSEAQRLTHQRDANGDLSSSRILKIKNGEDLSDDDLLKLHGFDPRKFKLTSATSNFWGNDKDSGQALYQTKIKATPLDWKLDNILDSIDKAVEPLDTPENTLDSITAEDVEAGTSLVIPLFDLHFGITTRDSITPYLLEIQHVIDSKRYKVIHFVLGGDLFHSDFMTKTQTASGTQLDHVDSVTALDDATAFISALITDAYQQADHVSVHFMRGNHDQDKSYVWAYGMKAKYANSPVSWSLTTRSRDAFLMDHVGVMYSHGDKPRQNKLSQLFAVEYPDIWSEARYRLILTGHYHNEQVKDDAGVVLMQMPTAKPTDRYEDANGYTMSRKKLEVLEFDSNHLICTHYIEPQVDDPDHLLDGLIAYA